MKKKEYIEKLPGELPKEDINKMEDFFSIIYLLMLKQKQEGILRIMFFFIKTFHGVF